MATMKAILILTLAICTLSLGAQNSVYTFEATKVNINYKGEKTETSTGKPSVITVNLADNVLTLESTSSEITDLMKGQMSRKIEKQLGDASTTQYSLLIEGNIFVHFYMDKLMIIFTRNDIHPLEWGIQFKEIRKIEG